MSQKEHRKPPPHRELKSGLLWKRGLIRPSWKLRYFVLTSTGMTYFHSQNDMTSQKGELLFNENSTVEIQPPGSTKTGHSGSTNWRFSVAGSRIMLCASQTEREMHEWAEAIKIATAGNRVSISGDIPELQLSIGGFREASDGKKRSHQSN